MDTMRLDLNKSLLNVMKAANCQFNKQQCCDRKVDKFYLGVNDE